MIGRMSRLKLTDAGCARAAALATTQPAAAHKSWRIMRTLYTHRMLNRAAEAARHESVAPRRRRTRGVVDVFRSAPVRLKPCTSRSDDVADHPNVRVMMDISLVRRHE
jgi:hypothetical protein